MHRLIYEETVRRALAEDLNFGDLTTDAIVQPSQTSKALMTAKQEGVIAGLEVAATAFELVDRNIDFQAMVAEGAKVQKGETLAVIKGSTASILSAERIALNFLQRLSGIASYTRQAVDLVQNYRAAIIDTRKTTPGLRALEKYAVTVGGGRNHRFSLSDAVMIKDNHIEAAGSIQAAVERVRQKVGPTVKVEVETESLEQVRQALAAGADIIMLDNMEPELMREAVILVNGRSLTEASGGIHLGNLEKAAATGVDLISLGWLTHSVSSLDISLNIVE